MAVRKPEISSMVALSCCISACKFPVEGCKHISLPTCTEMLSSCLLRAFLGFPVRLWHCPGSRRSCGSCSVCGVKLEGFFTLSQCLYRAVALHSPSWSVPEQQPHNIPGLCVINISQAKIFLHSEVEQEHSGFLFSLACTYKNEDGNQSRY